MTNPIRKIICLTFGLFALSGCVVAPPPAAGPYGCCYTYYDYPYSYGPPYYAYGPDIYLRYDEGYDGRYPHAYRGGYRGHRGAHDYRGHDGDLHDGRADGHDAH